MIHLGEQEIQGLADGTLRGPDGLAARDHCEICPQCDGEVSFYEELAGRLSALEDPEPPGDFTAAVLAAVDHREALLVQRRHTLYAALPAFALALFAIVGWGVSSLVDVAQVVDNLTALHTLAGVLGPVFAAVRVPLGIGAFVLFALVLTALSRTLRPSYARAAGS